MLYTNYSFFVLIHKHGTTMYHIYKIINKTQVVMLYVYYNVSN